MIEKKILISYGNIKTKLFNYLKEIKIINFMKTLCIIPCFNEEHRIESLLKKIKKFKKQNKNIDFLFINDGSTDATPNLISKNKFKIINFTTNMGIGRALINGYIYAKKNNYSILVHFAGNGKMNPDQINKVVNPIKKNNADFVSGSRFLKNGGIKNTPYYRIFLIFFFSKFVSFLFKRNISDASCGFRAFKLDLFNNFQKNYNQKRFYKYGYEYYTFGKIISNKNKKFKEVSVTMNYPSKTIYTKMRPFIDWFAIVYYWLLGYYDNVKI